LLKPSDWLEQNIEPSTIYEEPILSDLVECGFRYSDGLLTSFRMGDRPYLNYGRLASVDLHTPHELRHLAHGINEVIDDEAWEACLASRHRLLFGWEIVKAVWRCCGPIIALQPPSTLLNEPWRKMRLDIDSLRRIGL